MPFDYGMGNKLQFNEELGMSNPGILPEPTRKLPNSVTKWKMGHPTGFWILFKSSKFLDVLNAATLPSLDVTQLPDYFPPKP